MRLIDADALIKDIDYSADMGGSLGKVVECVKYYAKFMVASAPTIEERKTVSNEEWTKARGGWTNQPERKKGKWIQREKCYPEIERQMDYRYECSECGFSDIHNATLEVPFCWHCGARMER